MGTNVCGVPLMFRVYARSSTDLGIQDIVMDDCSCSSTRYVRSMGSKAIFAGWHDASRDPDTGAPRPDPERFPNGIKAVSDKVHALGLKVVRLKSFF